MVKKIFALLFVVAVVLAGSLPVTKARADQVQDEFVVFTEHGTLYSKDLTSGKVLPLGNADDSSWDWNKSKNLVASAAGPKQISVTDLTTEKNIFITVPDEADTSVLSISPDGTQIAYAFYVSNVQGYQIDIQPIQSDSKVSKVLTCTCNIRKMRWVNDSIVAYTISPDSESLAVIDVTGKTANQDFKTDFDRDMNVIGYSVSDRYIAIVYALRSSNQNNWGDELVVADLKDSKNNHIVMKKDMMYLSPVTDWSGNNLTYSNNGQIWVVDVDEKPKQPVQITTSNSSIAPRFSSTGNKISFLNQEDGVEVPYVMRADGNFPEKLSYADNATPTAN